MKALKTFAAMMIICVAAVTFVGCGVIENPYLTQANFDQIEVGATTQEAKEILGAPQKTTTVGFGELAMTTMIWSNNKKTEKASVKITLTFLGNSLSLKTSKGLS